MVGQLQCELKDTHVRTHVFIFDLVNFPLVLKHILKYMSFWGGGGGGKLLFSGLGHSGSQPFI